MPILKFQDLVLKCLGEISENLIFWHSPISYNWLIISKRLGILQFVVEAIN